MTTVRGKEGVTLAMGPTWEEYLAGKRPKFGDMKSFTEELHPRDRLGRFTSGGGSEIVNKAPDTSSPAWQSITKEIRAQGQGNCYQAAATLAINADELGLHNARVVQATVMGQGELAGMRFGHSWLEADAAGVVGTMFRNVYDWSSGGSTVMPDILYHDLGQVKDVHEYTADQAFEKMLETETYGPWE